MVSQWVDQFDLRKIAGKTFGIACQDRPTVHGRLSTDQKVREDGLARTALAPVFPKRMTRSESIGIAQWLNGKTEFGQAIFE